MADPMKQDPVVNAGSPGLVGAGYQTVVGHCSDHPRLSFDAHIGCPECCASQATEPEAGKENT